MKSVVYLGYVPSKTLIGIIILFNLVGIILFIRELIKERNIRILTWDTSYFIILYFLSIITIDIMSIIYFVGGLIGKLL